MYNTLEADPIDDLDEAFDDMDSLTSYETLTDEYSPSFLRELSFNHYQD